VQGGRYIGFRKKKNENTGTSVGDLERLAHVKGAPPKGGGRTTPKTRRKGEKGEEPSPNFWTGNCLTVLW